MKTWLVNDGEKVHCIQAEFLKTEWVGSECNIGILVFQDITRGTLATFAEWKWCKDITGDKASIEPVVKPDNTTKHPMQPIVIDDNGIARFKHNEIVRQSLEASPIVLNNVTNPFSADDRSQLAQLLGYTVANWAKQKCVSSDDYREAKKATEEVFLGKSDKPPKAVPAENTHEVVDAMTGVEELIYGFPPIKPEGTEEKP